MNTNREYTNDVNVRRAVIHAVDKAEFIENEFAGLSAMNGSFCDSVCIDIIPVSLSGPRFSFRRFVGRVSTD